MTEEEKILKNKFSYLAERSYERGKPQFTDFISSTELQILYAYERELSYANPTVYGGYEDAERVVVGFSTDEITEKDFPFCALKILPKNDKFSDDLTHRDFLGAILNVGIERSVVGDICLSENGAVVFVLNRMAEYLQKNLSRVKHTDVFVLKYDGKVVKNTRAEQKKIFLSSLRIDAFIAGAFGLSREQAEDLFKEKRVFVGTVLCEKQTKQVNVGDKITVRGKGRCVFVSLDGESKKGRLCVTVEKNS